jgi:hypothetical protein
MSNYGEIEQELNVSRDGLVRVADKCVERRSLSFRLLAFLSSGER